MPFGDYDSFDACTREHSDKEDPGAYCAEIHYQITGEYPGQEDEKSASDFYSDPDRCIEYALEAKHEVHGGTLSAADLESVRRKAVEVSGA